MTVPHNARRRTLAFSAYRTGELLAWGAFVLNVICVVPALQTKTVAAATGLALASMILIVASWRQLPRSAQVVSIVLVGVNLATLMDASARRLPALMGG